MKNRENVIRTMTLRQMRAQRARTLWTMAEVAIASGLLTAVLLGGVSMADLTKTDSERSEFAVVVLAAAAVVAVLLLFAAAFLIHSAFAVSLTQRVRALGQLASVGATRRQLRASVYWEALLLGALAVPAGMALAALGLLVTFSVLNRFDSVTRLLGPLQLSVSVPGLAFCAAWCAGMLFLAARGPARAAFRVEPIDTFSPARHVRGAGRVRAWKREKPPEPQLAQRSFALSGARQRALCAGMAVSLALVVTAAGFSGGLRRAYAFSAPAYDCRLYVWGTGGTRPEEALREAQNAFPDVPSLCVEEELHVGTDGATGRSVAQRLFVLEDEAFTAWYGAPLGTATAATPCVLSVRDSVLPEQAVPGLLSISYLAPLRQAGTCETPLPLRAGERTMSMRYADVYVALVTSRSAFDAACTGIPETVDRSFAVYYGTKDGARIAPRLTQMCGRRGVQAVFQDYTPASEWAVRRTGITLLVNVFSWGFTVLVFLAAAVSLIGTVSADLALHRREIALLESAGMTRRQLGRFLRARCLVYCAGLPFGLAFGALLCLGLARLYALPFCAVFRPGAALVGAAALAGVCLLALFLARRSLAGHTVVESLREI